MANTNIKKPKRQAKFSESFAAVAREAEKEFKADALAKWRILNKLGAYNAKANIKQANLSKSRIRAIEKKFKEIQRQGKFVSGRTVRPLQKISYLTPTGRIKQKYDTSGFFDFVRSKVKTGVRTGIQKTSKGYIVEKTKRGAKIRINKKGEIVETYGGIKRKLKYYKDKQILGLMDDVESGKFRLKDKEILIFHKWGTKSDVFSFDDNDDLVNQFLPYVSGLMATMPPKVFERFINLSEIEIVTGK